MLILTPSIMMFGQPNHTPEQDMEEIDDRDLRKRAKHLKKCKDMVWRRWRDEYLRGLREPHDLRHNGKHNLVAPGDVMIIKGDERNRTKWRLGIVDSVITGRDGVVRAARLRAGRDKMERAVQHLYTLELSVDRTSVADQATSVDDDAATQDETAQHKRGEAAVASVRITNQAMDEADGLEIE